MGHRRLAMVDAEHGTQPIFNEDQSVVVVANGEFYGAAKIRMRLEQSGHRFVSNSDSEILPHLYEQYGDDFLQHLRGEFAFLLWDQKNARLIAARDRFGIKPLVYYKNQSSMGFASEAKALFPELLSVNWDVESLAFATTLQYLPPNRTLFDGVFQVPPGYLAISENGNLKLQRYWDIDYPAFCPESEHVDNYQESVRQTRSLLVQSVVDRIPAEVKGCFHLSGGIDSSAVLGIASRETGLRQTAFTIECPGEGYDETEFAKSAAKFCGAELHRFRFSPQQYIDSIFAAARASEGLAINGHLPAKYLLNREIHSQGFKAVLTGEGADETFLGYTHLRLDFENCHSAPPLPLLEEDRASLGMMLPLGDSLSTNDLLKQLGFVPTFLAAKATLGCRIHSLLTDHTKQLVQLHRPFSKVVDLGTMEIQLTDRHPVHQSTWLWSKWAMAGYILKTLGDGTEMPSSIEGRTPFLDHQLFEFVRRQPLGYFFRNGTAKQLLRDAVRPYVTPEIYQRVKHPFDTAPFLLGDLALAQSFLYDQLNSEAFRSQPIFCESRVRELLNRMMFMDEQQRQAWDPVVTLMCTVLGIQELID